MELPRIDDSPTGRRIVLVLLAAILVTGAARIAATWTVFSPTYDEPAQIATGMEWIERGTYEFAAMHPPLARVFAAAPLYWSGVRMSEQARRASCERDFLSFYEWLRTRERRGYFGGRCLNRADEKILWHGDLVRNTALVRLGVLPFYLVGCAFVFALGRALFDVRHGLLAVGLFSAVPVVLGHAGLANTDMAATATWAAALHCGWLWIERASAPRSLAFGASLGAALVSKFSNLLFLPLGLLPLLAVALRRAPHGPPPLRAGALAIATGLVLAWAVYRFSLGPPAESVPGLVEWVAGLSTLRGPLEWLIRAPLLPAPDLLEGLLIAFQKNAQGHATYLLGEPMRTGAWPFFPVVFLAKTPLSLLVAFGVGAAFAARGAQPAVGAARILLVVFALTLAAAMASSVNIGLRHILHIYVPTSLLAAYGLIRLGSVPGLRRALAVALVAVYAAASLAAHPEYFTYFNLATAREPERIVVDSDLDWGQDVYRLARVLEANGVETLTVCAYGFDALTGLGPYRLRRDCPTRARPGWLAVSLNRVLARERERLAWLAGHEPVARVGRSILLYRFDGPGAPVPPTGTPQDHK